MFNDLSSPLSFLATRRSGKPRDLVAPGPSDAQLRDILRIATRVPDHGKLAPWRFIVVPTERRDAFAALLSDALRLERPGASERDVAAVINDFAFQGEALIVALSAPQDSAKIPLWEQKLSAGAACMQLLNAAHAMGFAGGWLTGWAAYSDHVRNAFGGANERIAGFIFLGTPGKPLEERPRPDFDATVRYWTV